MTFRTALVPALFASVFVVSCTRPDPHPTMGASRGRDYWGHRPGPRGFRTVVVDAGHGGKDNGATSRTTRQYEKDLTLDLARRIRSELGGRFRVVMMRDADTFIELDERAVRANRYGDAVLISVHFNSTRSSRIRGPETYYWRVDSHGLAVRLQQAMSQVSPVECDNRGLVRRRLRLTRNPEIPSVLLECGYLSHPAEARLAAKPAYRQQLAHAIAGALRQQAASGDAGTGPLPEPINAPPSRATDARE